MLAFLRRILNRFISLFWKEEMEITLVGLQMSGKTTFVNVISVSWSSIIHLDHFSLEYTEYCRCDQLVSSDLRTLYSLQQYWERL